MNTLAVVASLAAASVFAAPSLPTVPLTFPDGKTITVDIAATPREREIGLMNRKFLPKDYGMLFVFSQEQPLQFWMKNTWVDLDMVFIGRDKKISALYKSVPRSYENTTDDKVARRDGIAQFVLELPKGAANAHHLKKGQKLTFDVTLPLY